jgi:hypothetical protein
MYEKISAVFPNGLLNPMEIQKIHADYVRQQRKRAMSSANVDVKDEKGKDAKEDKNAGNSGNGESTET